MSNATQEPTTVFVVVKAAEADYDDFQIEEVVAVALTVDGAMAQVPAACVGNACFGWRVWWNEEEAGRSGPYYCNLGETVSPHWQPKSATHYIVERPLLP